MVAITGATGLLGNHIVQRFLSEGESVVALYRQGHEPSLPKGTIKRPANILHQVSLREAFEGCSTVIHAAALVSFNPRNRKKIFEINVEGTRNVVDTCLQLGVRNLIHISSVAALGRKSGELINEENKWTGLPSSDYAKSKHHAELEVYRGAEEGLTVSIVNPSVILSAEQPDRSSAALFRYVQNERPFYTNGSLNYVDARDVAEAVFQLYKKPQSGEKFILSAGTLPYRDFFSLVAKQFNTKAPRFNMSPLLLYCAGWLGEVQGLLMNREPFVTRQSAHLAMQSFNYSNRKAQEIIGIQFRTIENTIEWCCEAYRRNVKANK